jgi:integrase
VPYLGEVALRDIDAQGLEGLYGRLLKAGGSNGAPLSARSVKHIHDTVRCCLNAAIRWNRILVNPAIACQLPKIERTEAKIVEDGQLEFLVDAGRGHRWLYALLAVASATGLRRGELLALSWPDADLEYNSLTVSKSLEQTRAGLRLKKPKNGKTRRLPLPAVAVEVLRDHRQAQQEFRKAFGADYRTDLDLIFCSPEGDHLKPNTVSPAVCLLAEKCGLKGIGLHSLRHTHGSQLLSAGVPLPTVSKRLGHSSVAVTAAIYAHSFAADEIAAAEAWEAKLGNAIRKPVAPFGTTKPS